MARSPDSSAPGARDEAVGPLAGGEDDAVTDAAFADDAGGVGDGEVDDVSAAVGRSSPASSSSSPCGNDTWPRERRRTMGAAVVAGLEGAGLEGAGLEGAGLEGAGLDDAGLDDAGLDDAGLDDAGLDDFGRRGTRSGWSAGGVDSAEAEGAPGSSGAGRPEGAGVEVAGSEGRLGWVEAGPGDGAAAVGRTSDCSADAPGLSPDGASTGAPGADRDTTSPGTMAGPPPRRRTTVVLSTPGNDDGGISGMDVGSVWAADPTGRSAPTEAGLETRRRTASGVGRVDAGGAGRAAVLAFAAMRRGRGAGGRGAGRDGSSMSSRSSKSSAGVIRWSSCGADGRSCRRARLLTRPATCMSTVWVSSVSATAVGRRVTR